jgi:hypothetical protein
LAGLENPELTTNSARETAEMPPNQPAKDVSFRTQLDG